MSECKFCKKIFTKKFAMTKHQRHAKYCLKIQSGESIADKNISDTTCTFCDKVLSCKRSLKRHQTTCKKKKKELSQICELTRENDELKEAVKVLTLVNKKLKAALEGKVSSTTNNSSSTDNSTTNNTINNHFTITHPITNSTIKKIVQAFTLETFKNGAQGLADLLIENNPPNSIICRDRSRQIFEWKSDENMVIKDKHLYHLMSRLCKSLKTRSGSLLKEAVDSITEIYNKKIEVDKAKGLPDKFISAYCDTKIKLIDTYKKYAEDIKTMSQGTICEATKEFARIVGIKLLPTIELGEESTSNTIDYMSDDEELINMMLRNTEDEMEDESG